MYKVVRTPIIKQAKLSVVSGLRGSERMLQVRSRARR